MCGKVSGNSTREIGKKQRRGVKREAWEVRQDFDTSEAVSWMFFFSFDEEGNKVELDFEAVKRV